MKKNTTNLIMILNFIAFKFKFKLDLPLQIVHTFPERSSSWIPVIY